jgi:DNA-directed RNA polymerase specialized sigma24 family protein
VKKTLDMHSRLLAAVRSACYAKQQWLHVGVEGEAGPCRDAGEVAPAAGSDPRHRIDAALQRLPIELREVILLREMEGLSYAAMSSITGLPLCAVMSRLSLARSQLARQLAR